MHAMVARGQCLSLVITNELHPMNTNESLIELDMAQVAVLDGHLVEVRIRQDVRIDVRGLLESMHARRQSLPAAKGAILFIAKGDLDWDPAALQTDFFGEDVDSITGVGVLLDSKVLTLVANMYFSLFPARFPTLVSSDEAAMRRWLDALRD